MTALVFFAAFSLIRNVNTTSHYSQRGRSGRGPANTCHDPRPRKASFVAPLLLLAACAANAALEFNPASLDFGTVGTDSTATRQVWLRNAGDRVMVLDWIGGALDRLLVSPGTAQLDPGDSLELTVDFQPRHNLAYDGLLVASGDAGATVATYTGDGDLPGTIWDGTFDLSGEALKSALLAVLEADDVLSYDDARLAMYSDIDNEDGWVESVYIGLMVQTWGIPDPAIMNTEHTWPQSKGATGDARRNLHHLFPCDSGINSSRGNLPFGLVVESSGGYPINGTDRGQNAQGITVFEPRDVHKGDCCRAMLFFALRYGNREDFLLEADQETVLTDWHWNFEVSQKELDRNEAIYGYQNSRNPFVDHPLLMERLAGLSGDADLPTEAELLSWPPALDLGEMSELELRSGDLLVYNGGTADLQIVSQDVVPACFTVEALPGTLPPGAWQLLEVSPLTDCGEDVTADWLLETSDGSLTVPLHAVVTPGVLEAPQLNVEVVGQMLHFSWPAVSGALYYKLQFAIQQSGPWIDYVITAGLEYDIPYAGMPTPTFYRLIAIN